MLEVQKVGIVSWGFHNIGAVSPVIQYVDDV